MDHAAAMAPLRVTGTVLARKMKTVPAHAMEIAPAHEVEAVRPVPTNGVINNKTMKRVETPAATGAPNSETIRVFFPCTSLVWDRHSCLP